MRSRTWMRWRDGVREPSVDARLRRAPPPPTPSPPGRGVCGVGRYGPMKSVWRNRVIGVLLALVVFGLDQWLKFYVTGPLGLTVEGDHLDLLPFFDFTRTHNIGVSLGMLKAT